jgi:alkanesulfonate monooxygenase SsuD/methylene tetrahydromethanopterin reductase-like flavin-dependent oxidoreductase (luciferase family)
MGLQFGLLWPFRNPAFGRVSWKQFYRSQLDLIAESESLGFDHVWLSEHHFVDDGYSPSLHTIGAAIAARTTRIRIGTFLLLLPLHNPVRIAEDSATLDLISAGRFDLGVGLGYRRREFDDQGISHATRGARMEEGLEIVRGLLGDKAMTFDGEFNHLTELRITPPALQRPHPPMWVGAVANKAIERAARMGFHFLNGSGQPDRVEAYDDALRAYGREPEHFKVASKREVYVAPSREEAWAIVARPLHYAASRYLEWYSEANDTPDSDATKIIIPTVEEIVRSQSFDFFGENAIIGTPEDVIEAIEEYRSRIRMTHLVCSLPLAGMPARHVRDGMDLFARKVIPYFRQYGQL